MITGFAKHAPEEVRAMYRDLFDEGKDVYERIAAFKKQSSDLLDTYGNEAKQHYQNENSITTYLWLRYPDTYYIYKLSEVKKVADVLHCDYRFKKGAYRDNLQHFYKIYDEICEELKLDTELVDFFSKSSYRHLLSGSGAENADLRCQLLYQPGLFQRR